jgi:hypothetical protein
MTPETKDEIREALLFVIGMVIAFLVGGTVAP